MFLVFPVQKLERLVVVQGEVLVVELALGSVLVLEQELAQVQVVELELV